MRNHMFMTLCLAAACVSMTSRTASAQKTSGRLDHKNEAVAADHPGAPAVPVASTREALPDRPAVLAPLYVSFAALQLLDIHSTLRAPDFGAREANPLVTGLLASPAAFVATKAVVTTSLIYMSERLRRRHPRTAVLMMIGLNSAYAVVVARNYITEARAGIR